MAKAITFGLLSAVAGIVGCFILEGFGVVFSISVIGIGIISSLEKKEIKKGPAFAGPFFNNLVL